MRPSGAVGQTITAMPRTLVLTAFALLAFSANSVLCRLALGSGAIDAATFTAVRLLSGAAVLAIVLKVGPGGGNRREAGTWISATLLFAYATAFSFAYLALTTGTGALVLFGAVQITMISAGFLRGERLVGRQWLGMATAIGGLVALTFPGLTAPSLRGALLMALAGAAWGLYSLRGRGSGHPVAVTAGNFARSAPLAFGLVVGVGLGGLTVTPRGAALAIVSGALTSGLGYVIWYAALPGLSATRAAIVQLAVPVIAAAGGVVLLSEPVTFRLVAAGVAVLGGIGVALVQRRPGQG